MEQSKPKPKRYLETKFARAASVIITAHKYRNSPANMAEFIENNLSYFPNVDENTLDTLRKGVINNDDSDFYMKVPTFADLNSEENDS